jgi:hypothetical protein
MLDWALTWQSCDEYGFKNNPLTADMIRNTSTWSTWFTIQNSAPKVDLAAATANKSCPGEYGVAINVTDKTMQVPSWVIGPAASTPMTLASASPTPTPDPCRVDIDSTICRKHVGLFESPLVRWLEPASRLPGRQECRTATGRVQCILLASCMWRIGILSNVNMPALML